MEAFLYLHISDRAPDQPLNVPFNLVQEALRPLSDPPELPLDVETDLHNEELENLFREEFGFELPRPGATRKRTFEGRLKEPPVGEIAIE